MDLQTFLEQNRKNQPQSPPVDLRAAIEKTNERQENQGFLPYMTNAINSVNRVLTQAIETPYNIVNNAPRLLNLLPGEQGMGSLDEMGAEVGGPIGNFFAGFGKDPLIDAVAKYYPGMDQVGGINQPNPNYPRTSQFAEDVGLGLGGLGAIGLAAKTPGIAGKFAQYLNAPLQAAPARAVGAEVAAAGGAAVGREVADRTEMGPVGSFMAEFLGSMGPGAVAYAGPRVLGGAARAGREGGVDSAREVLEAMDRRNIRPSIGITGGRMAAQAESGASALPFFSAVPENVRNQQFEQFSDALTGAADNVRPAGSGPMVNPTDMSSQVYDIAEGGAKRMKSSFGGREDALQKAIGAKTPIDVTSTRKAIAEMIPTVDPEMQAALRHELDLLDQMVIKNKQTTMQSKASSVLGPDGKPMTVDTPVDTLTDSNTVSYEQFRSWRTNVGRRTDQPSIKGGQSKRLYSAITEDLTGAAEKAGVGDDFRTLMRDQAQAHADDVRLSQGGDLPQAEKLGSGQLERSGQFLREAYRNPEKMDYLRRNATPEQWDQLRGDIAHDLGLARAGSQDATGDTISPNKLITEWHKMDPRVKNMLFDDDLGTRQTMDDLILIAESFKKRGLEANSSRTAGTGMGAMQIKEAAKGGALLATGAAGYANLPATVAGAGLTYATVKGLMSETLARWAAGQTPSAAGTVGARLPGAAARAATDDVEVEERPPMRVIP